MEVTRTSLRAQRNQQAPKQVRQGRTQEKGGYGEEVKQQGQKIFNVRSERPVIKAEKVEQIVSPTEQYTRDAVKTAMEKLKKIAYSQGLGGDTSGATEQTTAFTSTGGGGGKRNFFSGDKLGNLSYKNMPFVPQDQYKGVETDNLRYGDTMPEGAFGIGSKATDDFTGRYPSTAGDFDREKRGPIANLPSDYKQTEQRAFDDAEAYRRIVAAGLDKTVGGEDAQVNVGSGRLGTFGLGTYGQGAPTKPPEGSFSISDKGREQALQNRIEAGIKSTGIPNQVAVQGGAMSQAARDQAAINRGIKAAEATGIPSGADLKPGSFGISTIERTPPKVAPKPATPTNKMGGQGGLNLGTTTQRQGGTVDKGIKVAKKESPAVNASSFQQKNLRGGRKDESARPKQVKQTVASLPSNYAATEKKAFDKAKAYKASKADSKAKGDAAAKATNTPTKPKAGSFGISAAGRKQAEANKAEKKAAPKVSVNTPAKAVKVATKVKDKSDKRGTGFGSKPKPKAKPAPKKATPKQKTAVKKATTVKKKSTNTSKSRRRGSAGKKSSSSKKSSSKKSGGSKSGGSKSGGSKSAGSKKSSRGAKGGSSSRSRGGTSKGTSRRRTNRRRSRRRCDIRCKFDISILTNLNLIRDDLADVAYFVKNLQEIN